MDRMRVRETKKGEGEMVGGGREAVAKARR
jgi:hypothetical protein